LEILKYLSLVICPFICLFVLIFQHPAPFIVLYIFLTISHSNILSTFVTSDCTTCSLPYSTMHFSMSVPSLAMNVKFMYCIAPACYVKCTDFNPLPSLTLQNAQDLNVPCRPKRSKVLLLSYTFKCLLKKTQSFCPCSRALNRSSKWLINPLAPEFSFKF
jgi:hypothetical protein